MESFFELLVGNTLTRLVFFPALACLPLLFFPRDNQRAVKLYALVVSLVELLLGLFLVLPHYAMEGFGLIRDLGPDGEPLAWVSAFGVSYDVVLDGIAMPLVVLTVVLLPFVLLGSWRGITEHWKGYAASMLLLTTGILGALVAWDLFLFYVFWEVMLVPMYLIIGIWGGEQRIYAAVKFFLYTMVGSLLMLLSILWLAWVYFEATGVWSFAYADLMRLDLPLANQLWLFAAFALAFAIKVPMFPFHTWLPDAHVQAPTGGSVILAGVLLKLGTYGFLRFALPMFPHASDHYQPVLVALALIGIVYGALVAWVQTDMKKLVAYSSIAHLGFVMLGLFAFDLIAWEGSLIQMVNHGISTGALFLLVGMLYDRRHTKKFEDFGGLAKVMPWFSFFLIFSALASVGLPGLNGFVGEFLILIGSYRTLGLWVVVATLGVVLAAVYLLKMLLESVWGPLDNPENQTLKDLDLREIVTLAPLAFLMLVIGVVPEPFLASSRPALEATLTSYQERLAEPAGFGVSVRDEALVAASLGLAPPPPPGSEGPEDVAPRHTVTATMSVTPDSASEPRADTAGEATDGEPTDSEPTDTEPTDSEPTGGEGRDEVNR